MTADGNSAQIRQVIEEAVKQANSLARSDRQDDESRGLRAQLTMTEKVVGACLIALIAWVGVTVQSTDKRVAVIEARLSGVTEGRYSISDAARDQQIVAAQMEALSQRVSTLEGKR